MGIAGIVKVDVSLVSRTLKKLETWDLVRKCKWENSNGNEKSMKYRLTEKGIKIIDSMTHLGYLARS